jgi:DNA repair protein RecO (recombination protein O)
MKQVLLQPAYVLHRRAYRESSYLVDLFTKEYGRMTVIATGVRKIKSSSQGILQPFIPLLVSWQGKGELMTLIHVEAQGNVLGLQGECLYAGFYLNELLMFLLQKWDAHPSLFATYSNTMCSLQIPQLDQKILRSFEKRLLEELGYGLHDMFAPDQYYRFHPEQGFVVAEFGDQSRNGANLFSGKSLLAIAKEDWNEEVSMQDAKRLTRFVLAPLLGMRQIHSRQLFVYPEENNAYKK